MISPRMLNVVIETFSGEYENVNLLLQMRCEYILSGNTIESQVGKFLTDLSDKLDGFATMLSNNIGDFDFTKLPVSIDDLRKLIEFVKSQKK